MSKTTKYRCAHCHHARRHVKVYPFNGLSLCFHHLGWAELGAIRAWLDSRALSSSDTGASR